MAKIKTAGRGKPTTVIFEFPSLVLEMVKNPNMYAGLNLLVLQGLKSKHSAALYELLKDYLRLTKFRCGIEDFRNLMGIGEKQYPIFTMLKKRVLDVAVDEINDKTDISVSYELERFGRKVIYIHFTMKVKKEALPINETHNEIRKKLDAMDVTKTKIEELIQHHDEQYLWANIAVVEQQTTSGKIKNLAAYLLKAFQNDYRTTETEYSK